LLFQLLFKIALGRTWWNLVDRVIAASFFFVQQILSGEFAVIAGKQKLRFISLQVRPEQPFHRASPLSSQCKKKTEITRTAANRNNFEVQTLPVKILFCFWSAS